MLIAEKNRQLVFNLKKPERVLSIIPTARLINYKGTPLVAVPHRLDETKVLRNLGFTVPSPATVYYKFPCQYPSIFDHQKVTVDFLVSNNRAYCLNDMGTAKTLSALWSYDYLREQGLAVKMLVMAPLSTLEHTWGNEIWRNLPHLTFAVLHGSRKQRLKLLKEDVDIYIINHDGLSIIQNELEHRFDITHAIIDEIGTMRNRQTDRWDTINAVCNGPIKRSVWGMTGTPTPNAPTDAWAQCKLVTPGTVPQWFGKFRDMTMRKVTQFKWVPRDDAMDIVQECMQPAIRYSRAECIDLPPVMYEIMHAELTAEQKEMYKQMLNELVAEFKGQQLTAVNEAVKINKLIQIACIATGTRVLSDRGWVCIETVTKEDLLWDGEDWVRSYGAVFKGVAPTVVRGGVSMTPDHMVLSTVGWKQAKEIRDDNAGKGFDRAEVRLPDCAKSGRLNPWLGTVRNMAVPLRVWEGSGPKESVPSTEIPGSSKELRVSSRERNAQAIPHQNIRCVGECTSTMRGPIGQRLEELRRAWDNCLRSVGEFVRSFLEGHGRGVQSRSYSGAYGQQQGVLARELPVGVYSRASKQQAHECASTGGVFPVNHSASGEAQGSESRYCSGAFGPWVDSGTGVDVFDIVNCGPRNRFVVRGSNGELSIVHNCGVAYDTAHQEVFIPVKPRLQLVKEVIESAGSKCIVFVPLTGALEYVAKELRKDYTVEIVHGGTSSNERRRIFREFQDEHNPRVLVANAGAMSHGLTLTAANTIIWFAPPNSNETYNQANARISRPGQKLNQLIVHIEGTTVERRIYDRLKEKTSMQGILLDMIQEAR